MGQLIEKISFSQVKPDWTHYKNVMLNRPIKCGLVYRVRLGVTVKRKNMADVAKSCCFCSKTILDRSYRSISSPTSQESYKYVFSLVSVKSMSGFVCNLCVNKLNRVSKLSVDMETKGIKAMQGIDYNPNKNPIKYDFTTNSNM